MAKMNKQEIAALAAVEAQKAALLGNADGVAAVEIEGGNFEVAFDYDRQLAKMLRNVPGAQFNQEQSVYVVPAASVDALGKVVSAMRLEHNAVAANLVNIKDLAAASGLKAQRDKGAESNVVAKVSDYRDPAKFYGGEILNANAHFVAQLTGFGKDDGAAFMAIHRLADLDRNKIMKGDNVGIKYDSKFLGAVSDLSKNKSAVDLEAEYTGNLGKAIDGVTVTERGDNIGVAFDMNPALLARIRRVDGAAFNKADKVWEVPGGNKEFVLRAVHDMRNEFVVDGKEIETMKAVAASKMDGPKVAAAFTKDGQEHFGKVIGVGDRYVLQKAGQEKFTLHHLISLDQKPEHDQNLSIKYNKGIGAVVDLDKQKAQDKALGAGR